MARFKTFICATSLMFLCSSAFADIAPEIPPGQKIIGVCVKVDMTSAPDYVLVQWNGTGDGDEIPGGRGTWWHQWKLTAADVSKCLKGVAAMPKAKWDAFKTEAATKVFDTDNPTTANLGNSEVYVSDKIQGSVLTIVYKAEKAVGNKLVFKKASSTYSN